MTSTAITPSEDMMRRLASGHDARGRPAPYLTMPTLAGAGALRSSITDMLRFAAANLDGDGDPLQRAMAATHSPRKKIRLVTRIGLNWHILGSRARSILSHSGGTAGFSSFIGLHPAHRTAIVVLSSRQTLVEDIGLHLLEKRLPLLPPPGARRRDRPALPGDEDELLLQGHGRAGDLQTQREAKATGAVLHQDGHEPAV